MDEQLDNEPVNRLDLLLLIQAYNRHELSLDEFLRLSKAWGKLCNRSMQLRRVLKQQWINVPFLLSAADKVIL